MLSIKQKHLFVVRIKSNKTIDKTLLGNKKTYSVFIGQVGRVFASGTGELGSIPGRVIPKTLKMVLDTALQYKVRIKGNVE